MTRHPRPTAADLPRLRAPLFTLTLAAVLAGCGGGGTEETTEAVANNSDGMVQALAVSKSSWTKIADEGQSFTVSSATVRYGAGSSWVTKTVNGTAQCTKAFFGSDPLPGTKKKCQISSVTSTSAPAPAASTSTPPAVSTSIATQWGTIKEPQLPATVCKTLTAGLVPVNGSIDALDANPATSQPNTKDIQQAIDKCPSGQAVKLAKGASGEAGFLSGPLKLKSGVALWIDSGVTLFASRNPADYDNGPGICGTAVVGKPADKSCDPLIMADETVGSSIVGDGKIDGRGGSLVTSGPNAGRRTWWDIAYQNISEGLSQQNPRLIQTRKGSDFTLYRVAVMNSPNFHIVTSQTKGVTAWGIKILSPSAVYTKPGYACPAGSTPDKKTPATCFTPETAKNTDGFDPALSENVLLAYSYISTGDDHVAVKSRGATGTTRNLHFAHNHFYYGHGLSIGSELDNGVSNMVVNDLVMDGHYGGESIGLRIKSDSTRGGKIDNISYNAICMRNVGQPLVFDTYYGPGTGSKFPSFTNIKISGFHYQGTSGHAVELMTFAGYVLGGQRVPLAITLDNVVFDGPQPRLQPGKYSSLKVAPLAAHFTFGPGAVSFASSIVASTANDVTITGTPGASTPVDCSSAFVPMSSALADAPI